MSKSLQARMTYLFAAFVLLVVVSVAAMLWGSETQRQDAHLINLAGRQRMLVQQMARLAVATDGAAMVDGALPEAERIFDQTQAALREGGVAPYPSGVPVTLPAAIDAELRAALDQVDLAWGRFRALLDQQQPELAGDYPSPAARQAVAASAAVLVERADQVVRLYEASATAKVNRLRAMQLGFLAAALALLATGAWLTRRAVLLPLQDLALAARRLGENDLDTAVQVAGPQEVQALSQAFDAMRLSLRASRAELLELAATLETRVDRRTRELNALNEVSREIASQLELRALLSSVADKARVLLDADLAMLCLLDDSRQRLQLKAASGEPVAQTGAVHASTDIALARGVLLSQHALMCSDAHCVSGCAMLADDHTASHVVAPLRIGDHVIGALCVTSAQPQHFPAESTELATKLANIAAVALQNARLYAQAEKVAALEERNRIAADMHDGLAQTLSYLGLVTDETVELLAEGEQPRALANLERTRRTLNQATLQVRESIRQLLDDAPRERRLPALLHETVREVEGKYRVGIDWQAEAGAPVEASRETAEQIVNIARETLENACRHAHARAIGVCYGRQNGQGVVTITDDGCGFDPAAQAFQGNGHFGLRVMRARAAHIGGELQVVSALGAGTSVTLLFPAEEPRR
jgi:two-component system nitrate/nitrite sensor histidine kinase NarX